LHLICLAKRAFGVVQVSNPFQSSMEEDYHAITPAGSERRDPRMNGGPQ